MAFSAATMTLGGKQGLLGAGLKIVPVTLTGSTTYSTGGVTVDLSQDGNLGAYGFSTEVAMMLGGGSCANTNGYVLAYDPATSSAPATGKILMYEAGADGAALDEVATNTTMSALADVRVCFIGI